MPPAYYKYGDEEVINFYTKIIEKFPTIKIIIYNFEKLCGYKFSVECVERLVSKFPDQIIGVKDSSYNLFQKLKILSSQKPTVGEFTTNLCLLTKLVTVSFYTDIKKRFLRNLEH